MYKYLQSLSKTFLFIQVVFGLVSFYGIRSKWPHKSNVSYIFLEAYVITFVLKFTNRGCIHYRVQIIFPQIFVHYQHTFFTVAWDVLCRTRKTLSWSVGTSHARCLSRSSSAKRRPQSVSFRAPKYLSRGALNREYKEDEEWFISLIGGNLRILCFNFSCLHIWRWIYFGFSLQEFTVQERR